MLYKQLTRTTPIDDAYIDFFNYIKPHLIRSIRQTAKEISFFGKGETLTNIMKLHYCGYYLWNIRNMISSGTPLADIKTSETYTLIKKYLYLQGINVEEMLVVLEPETVVIGGISTTKISEDFIVGDSIATTTYKTTSFWNDLQVPYYINRIKQPACSHYNPFVLKLTAALKAAHTERTIQVIDTTYPDITIDQVYEHNEQLCVIANNDLFWQIAKTKMVVVVDKDPETVNSVFTPYEQSWTPEEEIPAGTPIFITLHQVPKTGKILFGSYNRLVITNDDVTIIGSILRLTLPVSVDETCEFKLSYFV